MPAPAGGNGHRQADRRNRCARAAGTWSARPLERARKLQGLGRVAASDMKILVVGAGVIGTVYGAQLGAAGHTVSVLAHGARTDEVARDGLRAREVVAGATTDSPAAVLGQTVKRSI